MRHSAGADSTQTTDASKMHSAIQDALNQHSCLLFRASDRHLQLSSLQVVARSRVVSVLDSGAVGLGFKSQPRCCRVTVLGKLFTPIVPLCGLGGVVE